MQESAWRSIAKTLTWRTMATSLSLFIAYEITGSMGEAGGIALSTALALMVLYYFHERLWNRIDWGRK